MKTPILALPDPRLSRAHYFSVFRRSVAALLACALLSGCISTQSVNTLGVDAAQLPTLVRVGDSVRCAMRNGTAATFRVTAIEPGVLIGDSHRLAFNDIARIDIMRFSGKRTAMLGAAVVITAALVVAVAAASTPVAGAFVYP
jgi:hypothetical protein